MKILRSVNRRSFSVATAGWFTILKPNTWFPATRLPHLHRAMPTTDITAPIARAASAPSLTVERNEDRRDLTRMASIVFGALAITTAMLWWIMHP